MRRHLIFPLLAALLAVQPAPSIANDYAPFDPARIGLPALTDLGIDYLIEQHKRLIEDARREIAALQAGDLSNAAEVIARYEETIREEFRQIARLAGQRTGSAKSIASRGAAADLPVLRGLLTTVLQASRFNQLMGNEAEALAQWGSVVDIAKTFASSFRQNCYGQVFEQDIALGLDRQQDMLGTGIDVTPCAKRRFSIELAEFKFENCSIWTEGEWELERHDRYPGKGNATLTLNDARTSTEGDWHLQFSGQGVTGSDGGQMRVIATERRSPAGQVSREYKLNLTFDSMDTQLGKHAADVSNERAKYFPVKMSETPCRNAQG